MAALVRSSFAEGSTAVIQRKGNAEAGAIFVIVDRLNGSADLYGPAPQTAFEDRSVDDRLFQVILESRPSQEVAARIAREIDFDPDLWVVAVENRSGEVALDTV